MRSAERWTWTGVMGVCVVGAVVAWLGGEDGWWTIFVPLLVGGAVWVVLDWVDRRLDRKEHERG